MKLDRLAAIAEIVSSIAIVATLIYLAAQTQQLAIQTAQTNSALMANSRAATMSADINFLAATFGGADVNAVLFMPPDELSQADVNRLIQWLAAMSRIREFAWFQFGSGVMDEQALRSYLAPLVDAIQWPSLIEVWPQVSVNMDPDFVAYVNALRDE